MAKAQINYKEEAKVVIQQVPDTVTIELTVEEACFLATVLTKIGDCPHETIRHYQNSISQALYELDLNQYKYKSHIQGTLTCIR